MNFRQKITLYLLLYIAMCSAAFAQVVEIPDPNLRAAIADVLGIPRGAPITQDDMNRLTHLDVLDQGIANLTGLEFAINLTSLRIADNPISDLRPLAGLTQLEDLSMWAVRHADISPLSNLTSLRGLDIAACIIDDISALATLTQLVGLNIRGNNIADIRPLSNLKRLKSLHADNNRITDVTPLSNLPRLDWLEIHHNQITDHSPLDALALSHFTYDQTCEMPPLPLEPRLANRNYPSVFTRWGGASRIDNRPDVSLTENTALHDLWYDGPQFDLEFQETSHGFAIAGILDEAVQRRDEYLSINPNMVFIVDIRMREEWVWDLPENWPGWIRDADGQRVSDWPDAFLNDFTNPLVQDRIVQQAIAVSKCGLYDGIFFDYWTEKWPVLSGWRSMEAEQRARDEILRRIRAATRPNFLITGNVNNAILPRTTPYVNSGFMETVVPADRDLEDVTREINIDANSLFWLDKNLREPRVNGIEGWAVPTEAPDSPTNLRWMRAFTALSLTHSDEYVAYRNIIGDSYHWYDFCDANLGRPVGEKGQVYEGRSSEGTASAIEIPGLYIREFTNGWAVYNHSGAAQVITLPEEVQGVASGLVNTEHALPNLDGEMYLRVKPKNPADVNGDGVVNIFDLTIVAQEFGTDSLKGDEDGVVNVFDLVFVANQF